MQHSSDVVYFDKLTAIAFKAARELGLPLKACEPKRRPQTGEGLCYVERGVISVSVRGKSCKDSPLYDATRDGWQEHRYSHRHCLSTVAHELVHLKAVEDHEYRNHGKKFQELYAKTLLVVERISSEGA